MSPSLIPPPLIVVLEGYLGHKQSKIHVRVVCMFLSAVR